MHHFSLKNVELAVSVLRFSFTWDHVTDSDGNILSGLVSCPPLCPWGKLLYGWLKWPSIFFLIRTASQMVLVLSRTCMRAEEWFGCVAY